MARPRRSAARKPAHPPTLARIEAAGWGIFIHCQDCRMVWSIDPARLATEADRDRSIDGFRFLCETCGAAWPAWVEAPAGDRSRQRRIWPPPPP